MSSTEAPPLRTYRGNCHCTAFVYEIKVPEIKAVKQCNCSICHKKGYLWVFPGADDFNFVKGIEDDLTSYAFNDGKINHKVNLKENHGISSGYLHTTVDSFF